MKYSELRELQKSMMQYHKSGQLDRERELEEKIRCFVKEWRK